jgi:hypothetical protein
MTNTSTTTQKRYVTFYLVMLILTSISVLFTAIGFFISIPDFFRTMSFAPGYTISQIIAAVVTVIAIAALIFLWLKRNPLGIMLLLAAYVVLTLVGIATLFLLGPIVQDTTALTVKDTPDLPTDSIASITSFMLYALNSLAVIVNVVMATLWWFAYQSQRRADSEEVVMPVNDSAIR